MEDSGLIGLADNDPRNAAYYFLPTPPQTPMFESGGQSGDDFALYQPMVQDDHMNRLREVEFNNSSMYRGSQCPQQSPSWHQTSYIDADKRKYHFQQDYLKYRNKSASQNSSPQESISASDIKCQPPNKFISYNFHNKSNRRMPFPYLSLGNQNHHSYRIFYPPHLHSLEQRPYRQVTFPKPEYLMPMPQCQPYSGNQDEYQPRMTYQQRSHNSLQHVTCQSKLQIIYDSHSKQSPKPHARENKQLTEDGTRMQIHLVKIQFGDYCEYNIDKKIGNIDTTNNDENGNNPDVNYSSCNIGDPYNEDYLTQVTRIQKDRDEGGDQIEISDRRYGPPKFRYRYMEESIQLCLLQNAQIKVPLRSLRSIEKSDERVFRLELKNDSVARDKNAKYITMITHRGVVEKELDIIGLHIDYLVKMLNADNHHDPIFLRWRAVDWGSRAQQNWRSHSSAEKHKEEFKFQKVA
ncbi:15089_t:CDS:2 [Acaulospora colombiana]|uniref:15089_t:CDS:1 n=1 Tax=Acaulospora colombiana TaxID=27376 RepID=A0ACA9KX39_9GLOM|nr:15089_t:CDS:2 [Acaulospora colombiana]